MTLALEVVFAKLMHVLSENTILYLEQPCTNVC